MTTTTDNRFHRVKAWRDKAAADYAGPKFLGIPSVWTQAALDRRWICNGGHLLRTINVKWTRGTSARLPDESLGVLGSCEECGSPIYSLPPAVDEDFLNAIV